MLRKTKLGESDLIVTLLAENGAQIRAVAKGARKPTSSFASRLELFSVVKMFCARGRNLDIIKEAQLIRANSKIRMNADLAACASPPAELLSRITQVDLASSRLFAMTDAAFVQMNETSLNNALALCAAHLLKTLALSGLQPQVTSCVVCGAAFNLETSGFADFSYADGGVVCPTCRHLADTVHIERPTLAWCNVFLGATFSALVAKNVDPQVSRELLMFAQQWIRTHVGVSLKSLSFLITYVCV